MKRQQRVVIAALEDFPGQVNPLVQEGWRICPESFQVAGASCGGGGPLGAGLQTYFLAGCVLERDVPGSAPKTIGSELQTEHPSIDTDV